MVVSCSPTLSARSSPVAFGTSALNVTSPVPTPSVRTGLLNDIYLTLSDNVRFDGTEAPVKIFIKPLIVWLWIGG